MHDAMPWKPEARSSENKKINLSWVNIPKFYYELDFSSVNFEADLMTLSAISSDCLRSFN